MSEQKLKRYLADVPKPSAKRMHLVKVELVSGSGWGGFYAKELPVKQGYVEFEMDAKIKQEGTTSWMDGPVFYVQATFSNSTGSRKEQIHMLAVDIDG